MRPISRRSFIRSSAVAAAGIIAMPAFTTKTNMPLLSFSTLGCPEWSFDEIVHFAASHGYKGIEIRGIQKELDLTKTPAFSTPANIQATLALLKQNGLKLIDLGSSCNLHISDPVERKKNLDDARHFITLAQETGCLYVRVFPNNLPKDKDKAETLALIASGLKELGEFAANTNVKVLMETHGDVVHSDDIITVMQQAGPHTGLVWDIANMWTVTKEPVAEVYAKLEKYIHHTHIKDAKLLPGNELAYVLVGKGDVPIFEAIDLLYKGGYKGYYSFEWEKLWHPEIAAPELALADYPEAMKAHFAKMG
ncbi:MAG TPA: sugar phosphate isomerase/epimerase family protein [Chitinophagaceae bacterium]|nr:sugar phosphate isomerase/epimerase family protein [Chitinophagaceae bacterium]